MLDYVIGSVLTLIGVLFGAAITTMSNKKDD